MKGKEYQGNKQMKAKEHKETQTNECRRTQRKHKQMMPKEHRKHKKNEVKGTQRKHKQMKGKEHEGNTNKSSQMNTKETKKNEEQYKGNTKK